MMLDWLTQPLTVICLLLAVTACIAFRRGVRSVALLNIICLSLLWTLSTPEFANRWVERLESTRQNPEVCSGAPVEHMVVLGGGMNPWIPNSTPLQRLNRDSVARATAAAKVGLLLGGSATRWYTHGAGANGFTLAEDMAALMIENGVNESRIVLEPNSTTTQENAEYLTQLLPATGATLIHIATSALHVERAAHLFTAAGYQVCHLPNIDSRYSIPAPPVSLLPYLEGLEKTTKAWREQLARVKQRLTL